MKQHVGIVMALMLGLTSFCYAQDYIGVANRAPYKIRVPDAWDGKTLLVYAHGYGYLERTSGQFDYTYADAAPGGVGMEEYLLSHGYALAGSAFEGSGWQVKEGIRNTQQLIELFEDLVGHPQQIILIGYSLGSLIALQYAEAGSAVDGVISGCGITSGASDEFDLAGASALAYRTLFGWPASWGTWFDVNDVLSFQNDVLPVLNRQLTDPANFPKFEFIRRFGGNLPNGYYQDPGFLFEGMFFVTQGRAELEKRAGGPIVNNINDRYDLSQADKDYLASLGLNADKVLSTMNAQTTISSGLRQRQYLDNYYTPSGHLKLPVISMHSVNDGLVIPANEKVFAAKVNAAGRSAQLVQVFTNDPGHCTFTQDQLQAGISAMEGWLSSKIKPSVGAFPEALGFVPGYKPRPWPILSKGLPCDDEQRRTDRDDIPAQLN